MLRLILLLSLPLHAAEPKDFDKFWKGVKTELAAEALEPELTPDPGASDDKVSCFKAAYTSLGGRRVKARYCRPAGKGPFPAALISPWYGLGAIPVPDALARKGIAALWYQARGFDVDLPAYPVENQWYAIEGIASPETYAFRAIVAHGLRGLDFLASRPETDMRRVAALGASQGGGLSIFMAALDKRVTLVAADFPFLSDWEGSLPVATGVFADVRRHIEERPAEREAVMRTVAYFDALHAAKRVKARALVQAGLRDTLCVPEGIRKVHAALKSKDKRLVEFDAGHGDMNAERWRSMEDFVAAGLTGR